MPRAKKIFPHAVFGTRAVESTVPVYVFSYEIYKIGQDSKRMVL
jgi:hypothetical protein